MGEVLNSAYDLGALAHALRQDTPLPAPGPPVPFAVVPGPGLLGSVRTLKISSDTERLLRWVEQNAGNPTAATAAARKALTPLQDAGLVASTPFS